MIKLLEKRDKKEITHTVTDLVSKLGDTVDPISGESVVGVNYRQVTSQTFDSIKNMLKVTN